MSNAVAHLKAIYTIALLTTEDVYAIYEIDERCKNREADEKMDDHDQCAEDESDGVELFALVEVKDAGQDFALSASVLRSGQDHNRPDDMSSLSNSSNSVERTFDRLTINTYAIQTSVISADQY